jgi:hypothetical protein
MSNPPITDMSAKAPAIPSTKPPGTTASDLPPVAKRRPNLTDLATRTIQISPPSPDSLPKHG